MVIEKWIQHYNENRSKITNENLFKVMVNLGWIDWFCNTQDLLRKTDDFSKIFFKITNKDLLENYTLSFYNNCPAEDDLYDEIIFKHKTDNKKGGFLKINAPYKSQKYDFVSYYDFDHCNKQDYNKGLVSTYSTDNIKELIEFFNNLNL